MKKLSLLLVLILSVITYGQKKEQIVLGDEPKVVTYANMTVKMEKYYSKVLVSINAVKPDTPIIYKGVVSSTVGNISYNSNHISSEGWKKLESTDKSSGYLDYNNYGIMELTVSDMEDIYKIYIFSLELPDFEVGILIQINKL